jgi:transposase
LGCTERSVMDAPRKFAVVLTAEQRQRLEQLTRNGQAPAKKIRHARVLLMADRDHADGRWHDRPIAAALGVHVNTVARVRQRFATAGEQPALERQPRATPPTPPKLDGAAEAHLVALCCSDPPAGHKRWTLRLLVDGLRRRFAVAVCRETVRQALKKMSCSRGAAAGSASRNATWPGSSPRWRTSSTSMSPRPTPTSR